MYNSQALNNGSLVKRLRHGPLKAETGVRFSHESPRQDTSFEVSFFVVVTREENRDALKCFARGAEFAFR